VRASFLCIIPCHQKQQKIRCAPTTPFSGRAATESPLLALVPGGSGPAVGASLRAQALVFYAKAIATRSNKTPPPAPPVAGRMAIPSRRRRSWPSPPTTHAGMVIPSQRRRSPALISEVAFTTRYRGGTPRQRGAVRKASSTAQPRRGRVGGRRLRCGPRLWPRREWAARGPLVGPLEPGARSHRGGGGGCALALAVYEPPPRTHRTQNLLSLY
jgi:hypothetical protein